METIGFIFSLKFDIWGCKPQLAKPVAYERPGFMLKIIGFRQQKTHQERSLQPPEMTAVSSFLVVFIITTVVSHC